LVPNADRSPWWPPGVVGSITHSGDLCAVVVTHASRARGLGLDIEVDAPLDRAIEPLVATPAELAWLASQGDEARGWLGKLLFSAKEAFYKCQYPATQTFLEFHDVELRIDAVDAGSGAFTVYSVARDGGPWPWVAGARGRWLRADGFLAAGATL
jgi:4'-phosphopantetheinyl transferase EntD